MVDDPTSSRPGRSWIPFGLGVLLTVLAGMGLRAVDAGAEDAPDAPPPLVELVVTGCDELRAGSGTVVAPRLVVTAAHVVDRAVAVTIRTPAGDVAGTVVAIDPLGRDLALVLAAEPLDVPDSRNGRSVEPGEELLAFGHPFGGPEHVARGEVVALGDARAYGQPGDDLVVLSSGFPPGMSGGPVVDRSGWLVAIVVGTEQSSGTGLAVPVGELEDLLERGAAPAASVCLPAAPPDGPAPAGSDAA